jgi:hypothetical protein
MQPNNQYGPIPPVPQGPQSYSQQKTGHRINWWMISFILVFLLLLGATGFGAWAYMGRQDYKVNSDKKVSMAVEIAKKQEATTKDNEFLEKEKLPLKTYSGPEAYGSVHIEYPKTWSAYVNEVSGQSSLPVDGYFQPGFVPGIQSGASFALRVQVTSTAYDQELKKFDSYVKTGKAKVIPFTAPKVTSVAGTRVDGQIDQNTQGSIVLFPMRDKTLKVWTESSQFLNDFNTNILPNVTFVP